MSFTAKMVAVAGAAAITQIAVSVVHTAVTAPVPPIELTSLAWDGTDVTFSRTVHSEIPIRASITNEVVDVETERTVPGCILQPPRRADFRPDESRDKVFPMERFMSPECVLALIPGKTYSLISVIIPVGDGEPTALRSPPFVWPGAAG